MQNLRDNLTAAMNGDSGAPQVKTAAIANGSLRADHQRNVGPGTLKMYRSEEVVTTTIFSGDTVARLVVGFNGGVRLSWDSSFGIGIFINSSSVAGPLATVGSYDVTSISAGDIVSVTLGAAFMPSGGISYDVMTDSVITGHIAAITFP
jgi:hypothetical protein